MARFRYDRSSKWLLEHHGDQMLRLAGVTDVISWKPLQAEVVQPRQLPDGLLEVQRACRSTLNLFLIEIETYADRDIDDQLFDDVMLVYQDRRVVPDTVLLVLRPKGQAEVAGRREVASASGQTLLAGRWPVVELWKLPALDMLRLREPGLIPWVPLMDYAGPPEPLLQQCRQVIDEKAKPEEHANLLAVSQVLAGLRYNDKWLFNFFGGKEAMIESPVLTEFVNERVAVKCQQMLIKFLQSRFGLVAPDIVAEIGKITAENRLDELTEWAGRCLDSDAFRQKLVP